MLTSKLSFPASPLWTFRPTFLFPNNARCVQAEARQRASRSSWIKGETSILDLAARGKSSFGRRLSSFPSSGRLLVRGCSLCARTLARHHLPPLLFRLFPAPFSPVPSISTSLSRDTVALLSRDGGVGAGGWSFLRVSVLLQRRMPPITSRLLYFPCVSLPRCSQILPRFPSWLNPSRSKCFTECTRCFPTGHERAMLLDARSSTIIRHIFEYPPRS